MKKWLVGLLTVSSLLFASTGWADTITWTSGGAPYAIQPLVPNSPGSNLYSSPSSPASTFNADAKVDGSSANVGYKLDTITPIPSYCESGVGTVTVGNGTLQLNDFTGSVYYQGNTILCAYQITLQAYDKNNASVQTNGTPATLALNSSNNMVNWPGATQGYGSFMGENPSNNFQHQGYFTFLANATAPNDPSAKITYTGKLTYYTTGSSDPITLNLTNPTFNADDPRGNVGTFSFQLPSTLQNDATHTVQAAITATAPNLVAYEGSTKTLTPGRSSVYTYNTENPAYASGDYPANYTQPETYGSQLISRRPIQYGMLVVRMKPSETKGMVSAAYTFDYHTPKSIDSNIYYDWNWNEIDIEFVRNSLQLARDFSNCSYEGSGKWSCDSAYKVAEQQYLAQLQSGATTPFIMPQIDVYNLGAGSALKNSYEKRLWASRVLPTPYANQWLSGVSEDEMGKGSGHDSLINQSQWQDVVWPALFNLQKDGNLPYENGVSFDIWNVANKNAATIKTSTGAYGWRGTPAPGDTLGTIDANTAQNFMVADPSTIDLYNNFQTYTIVWTPHKIAFYVNAPNNGTQISGIKPVYVRTNVPKDTAEKAINSVITTGQIPTKKQFKEWANQMLGVENMGDQSPLANEKTPIIYDVNYKNSTVANPTSKYTVPWPNIMMNIWTDAPGSTQYYCTGSNTPANCGMGGWGGMVNPNFIAGSFDPNSNKYPVLSTKYTAGSEAQGVTAALYQFVDFYPLEQKSSGDWKAGTKFSQFVQTPAPANWAPPAGDAWGATQQYAFKTDFTKIKTLEELVDSGWFISNNAYGQSITANVKLQTSYTDKAGTTGNYLGLCNIFLPDYMPTIDWKDSDGNALKLPWPLYAKGCSGRYIGPTKDGTQQLYFVVQNFGAWNSDSKSINLTANVKDSSGDAVGVPGDIDGWVATTENTPGTAEYLAGTVGGTSAEATAAKNTSYSYAPMQLYRNTANVGRSYYFTVVPPNQKYTVETVGAQTIGSDTLYPHMCVDGESVGTVDPTTSAITYTTPDNVVMGDVGADRVYYADVYWTNSKTGFTCPTVAQGGDPAYVDMNKQVIAPFNWDKNVTVPQGNITETTATVQWDAASGGTGDITYEVQWGSNTETTTGTSYDITGLTADTNYEVTVTAIQGTDKIAAEPVSFTTTAPGFAWDKVVSVPTVGQTSADVQWDAATGATSPGGVSYFIQWQEVDGSDSGQATVSGESTTSYTIQSLKPGTDYTVTVTAIDGNDNIKSDPVSFSTQAAPTPTINWDKSVSVSGVTTTAANITWTAATLSNGPEGDAIAYQVDVNGTKYNTSSTSYPLTGLTPDTQYTVTVTAVDTDGKATPVAAPSKSFTTAAASTITAPKVTSATRVPGFQANVMIAYTSASGGDGKFTYRYNVNGKPWTGSVTPVSTNQVILVGVGLTPGLTVSVTATDGDGKSATSASASVPNPT